MPISYKICSTLWFWTINIWAKFFLSEPRRTSALNRADWIWKVLRYFRLKSWVQSQYREETFPNSKKVGGERRKGSGLILHGTQVLVTHYLLWALKKERIKEKSRIRNRTQDAQLIWTKVSWNFARSKTYNYVGWTLIGSRFRLLW